MDGSRCMQIKWRVICRKWPNASGVGAKQLRPGAGYFRKNQRRMQYQDSREEGWPIRQSHS